MHAVAFYISGHGFGHASRQVEVINAILARTPGRRIVVRSSVTPALFDRTLAAPVDLRPGPCDTGAAQRDSLTLDLVETLRRADEFHGTLAARAADEAARLTETAVRLVVGDVPPLAFAAAAEAGVASVALSNFTWDWIYGEYHQEAAAVPALLPAIRAAYRQATEAWRLPFGGGFGSFSSVRDLPLIARHARRDPADVRARLGLPVDRPLALVSFGGYGAEHLRFAPIDCLDRYGIVFTSGAIERPGERPAGAYEVAESRLYGAGIRYEDLVGAVDVVLTKPGYGIVSECIANGTALIYTSRGRFAEYDVLVAAMPRFVRCRFLDQPSLFAGRWGDALDTVLGQPDPPERLPTNGADVAAEQILALIE